MGWYNVIESGRLALRRKNAQQEPEPEPSFCAFLEMPQKQFKIFYHFKISS